ncbi:UDP-glucose 4-epimerase family protein [Vibrio sp. LaRot3]|uniref:UDP-glucose 4-epimerase family protein n=1 Tax=Vibrio sp. LaRot3 TaxID=2998829 RepID=UPI0022CDCDD4|nr:SDR family oxidoreductase [Vibrio sp. LaRot3]MDA0149404.1 SDR family oxidoreductase [Vibrio sp. LaRot3]
MKVLLTGATGFVGSHLMRFLEKQSYTVSTLGRTLVAESAFHYNVSSINGKESYIEALLEQEVVVHCAARAHVMKDNSLDPKNEYRETNVLGTLNLARQAAQCGVRRFVFVSSIKVNGENTKNGNPFTCKSPLNPNDAYSESKAEAEGKLLELAAETGLEVVIIRPTLVYGPGAKANFASLMNLVSKGIPLPFGCIKDNRRSLVSITNLVNLIITCIEHPKATNQVFLVSDDYDLSTYEIIRQMSAALGKPNWQLSVPVWCYQFLGKIFGKSDLVNRLVGSLQVDISHTKETLGWSPSQSIEDGFKETAQAFLQPTNCGKNDPFN